MFVRPRILVHICCAPDATAVFERLAPDYQIIGFFHNPNIHPEAEFKRRLEAAATLSTAMNTPLETAPYDPESWLRAMRNLEQEPEGGARCCACFRYNLTATAAKAREMGIPYFSSTLTISPHKKSEKVMAAGQAAAEAQGVGFIDYDFKKQNGFGRSLELSRQMKLYRQNYCGCKYSRSGGDHA